MPRFRKKPVEIEARPNDSTSAKLTGELADWCGGRAVKNELDHGSRIEITTLEGVMSADLGDWIIRGVQGEFYPCKPDIFEATYEAADQRSALVVSVAQTLRHHVMGATYCALHPWETSDHEPWLAWAQVPIDRAAAE